MLLFYFRQDIRSEFVASTTSRYLKTTAVRRQHIAKRFEEARRESPRKDAITAVNVSAAH